jgi:hypothetical protein
MSLKTEVFQNFRGINRVSDRLNMSPEFAYDILNGYIKKDAKSNLGVVTQRDGISKFNSVALGSGYGTTKKIRVVYEAKWNGGSTDIIIRAGTAWGKFDGVDTFDTIDTGRSDDVIGQCVMFKNELIMVDGGVPRKMTAAGVVSDLSADANMPQKSDVVWVHRDKVWLNDTDNPMVAHFSKTNNANGDTAWTGSTDAGTIDLSTVLPKGDRIMGFRTYGGTDSGLIAIICQNYTVIYAAGANVYTFTFVQLFPTTCLSSHALDYVGTDIVYPSRNSLTSMFSSAANNELEVNSLTKYIEPLYRDLVNLTSDVTQIAGVFNHKLNHYYITFPITNNYQTLVYSVDIGNFVGRWTYPVEFYSYCERQNGDILAGSDEYVYKINSGTDDDGTAIEWKLSMPAFYFKKAHLYKKPISFEVLLNTDRDITLYLDYWYGLSELGADKITKEISISSTASMWDVAEWDTSYWDASGNTLYRTEDLLGRGRMLFMEMRHNTSGAKVTMPWFIIGYILEGYK